jgi:uncharacterized 2Fe-2S/4Fe-4S cluster protein (DUF4445 family)
MAPNERLASERLGGDEASVDLTVASHGRVLRGQPGTTLLALLHDGGIPVPSSCGGAGTCGECRIRFASDPPPPTAADRKTLGREALDAGWRLACAHRVCDSACIEVPHDLGDLEHKAKGLETGAMRADAGVRTVNLVLPKRDVASRSKHDAVECAFGSAVPASLPALRCLAALSPGERATAVAWEDQLLALRPGGESGLYGVAIDVGTTTLAVYLVDLADGRRLATAASRNPQQRYGADVISRIGHVRRADGEGLEALRAAVVKGINALVRRVAEDAAMDPEAISRATVVGNPTMLHLLLGVDPRGIDVSPYVPVFVDALRCRAEEIGLAIAPAGLVDALPGVSAYVGADIVAGAVATDLRSREGTQLFLDIGTNGEVVLSLDGRLIACSTAAGPALEGASIVHGMLALDGAIEDVQVDEETLCCSVLGGTEPIGLCGTGLVAAVAVLLDAGIIDVTGRFTEIEGMLADRFEGEGVDRRFRLTDADRAAPVYLHQRDVREFQLAKAAIRSGCDLLLERSGLSAEDVARVLIAGAFSTRIAPEHLIATGLLPIDDPTRIESAGHAAGRGAVQLLLDRDGLERASALARSVEHVELSGDKRFAELFVERMRFPQPS